MNRLIIVEMTGNRIEQRVDEYVSKYKWWDIDVFNLYTPFKEMVESFKRVLANNKDASIVTYDKIYLLEYKHLFYNEETKRYEIYLLRDNGLINIHDATTKTIKKSHNLYNMYISRSFE